MTLSACGVVEQVNEFKDEASIAIESLDELKEDVEQAVEEASEVVGEVTEEMEEQDNPDNSSINETELRDVSDASSIDYDTLISMDLEPNEIVEILVPVDGEQTIYFISESSHGLEVTFREVEIDDIADKVIMLYPNEGVMSYTFTSGDGLIEIVNTNSDVCTMNTLFTESSEADTRELMAQLAADLPSDDLMIENLKNASFSLTSFMAMVEEVSIFEEDESIGLPAQPERNYFYLKGILTSYSEETINSDRLYDIFAYDDLGNQCGDASRWLADGNLTGDVDKDEQIGFQNLFLFDKAATHIRVEIIDRVSKEKVVSVIDVKNLNDQVNASDGAEEASILDTLDALSDEILMLIDENRFEELTDYVVSDVYFMPGPNIGFDKAIYLGMDDWSIINDYEDALVWGYYEGSGEDMVFTPSDFFDHFISNFNFRAAPEKTVKAYRDLGDGFAFWKNDTNGDYFVEYHYPGFNPDFEGIDYQTLYMVFTYDEEADTYLLTGITNHYWTI